MVFGDTVIQTEENSLSECSRSVFYSYAKLSLNFFFTKINFKQLINREKIYLRCKKFADDSTLWWDLKSTVQSHFPEILFIFKLCIVERV